MNVYLTGGAVRDIISGLPIRDLDFTVQGNALKLQKELERAGAAIVAADEDLKTLHLTMPGKVRAEVSSARTERYEKTGKPPVITPATIIEDLRRRDFTVNAMALSLNPGSRGLLLDPFNGVADIEAKLLRVLHNYAFLEDPSRLVRAIRFSTRFHWPLEEKTQLRFNSAKENSYIEHISKSAIGPEIEQLAYEDDPLNVLRGLEKEDWLKVLVPHWSSAKVDSVGLGALLKNRQQMNELGYAPNPAAAVMHFLTAKLGDKDIADMRKQIPRKDLVEAWKKLEEDAKELAKRLSGKEAATPSRTWKLLSEARADLVLFLSVTARQEAVSQKIKNFFSKWRQVQQRVPLPEMTELRITPTLPEYPKIAHDVFMLLLDGKLRSHNEIMKYLKPLAPPEPPPPPPPRRGRGAKAAAAAAIQPGAAPGKPGRKKKGTDTAPPVPPPAQPVAEPKPAPAAASKPERSGKPAKPAKAEASKAQKPSTLAKGKPERRSAGEATKKSASKKKKR
jgi:tRNA nucleotidyltransferase (CCA-adding enzyme)